MSATPALLLVDLQQDYLAAAGLTPDAGAIVAGAASLLAWFRERGLPVIHIHTSIAPDTSDAMPHWRESGEVRCITGSPGAVPPVALRPLPGESIAHKRFFSGFEDAALLAALRGAGVDTVVLAGVHTHACVRATALDAYANGFAVLLAADAVGSYDAAHAALSLAWLDGRAARVLPSASIRAVLGAAAAPATQSASLATTLAQPTWPHRDPTDWTQTRHEIALTSAVEVNRAAHALAEHRAGRPTSPIAERALRLQAWLAILRERRTQWVEALIGDLGKPRADAEGEVDYGLALVEQCCAALTDEETGPGETAAGRQVRYRPLGTVAIITPWNNPFAIPVSKLAPALGFGNAVLWKPALAGSAMARALLASLRAAGLGDDVALVTGDAATGAAVAEAPGVSAVSFTGSVAAGQRLAQGCGALRRPLQAELGGNNAAIVLADAAIEPVARDLAAAMFSFAGQRCTAIRRVIVERAVLPEFSRALGWAVSALRTGLPGDPGTDVGPVISRQRQLHLLALATEAAKAGATTLTGGTVPRDCPAQGCWLAPTVLTDLPDHSPIVTEELFGPVVALLGAADLEDALRQHNAVGHGLLGALYSHDGHAQQRFLAEAEAGLLVLNQARPSLSSLGPFHGWKQSGSGVPEHGRWNRDFYSRVQAVYGL